MRGIAFLSSFIIPGSTSPKIIWWIRGIQAFCTANSCKRMITLWHAWIFHLWYIPRKNSCPAQLTGRPRAHTSAASVRFMRRTANRKCFPSINVLVTVHHYPLYHSIQLTTQYCRGSITLFSGVCCLHEYIYSIHQAAPIYVGPNNKFTPPTDKPAPAIHTLLFQTCWKLSWKQQQRCYYKYQQKKTFLLCTSHLLLHCHLWEVWGPQPNGNYYPGWSSPVTTLASRYIYMNSALISGIT